MPLVSSKELLYKAMEGGYAVPAFNIENMETVQAVVQAAEEVNSPVILQTTPSSIKYAGLNYFYSMVSAAAAESKVPVVLHLDHGNSFELAVKAVRNGYTSVMIDGSAYPFEENIELTKKVVEVASVNQIPVEAELGKIGGKEDDLTVKKEDEIYTSPEQAEEFIRRTNVDSLAVAIGTAHGLYKGEPRLDFERLGKIRDLVDIPLVLHGATGVPDPSVRRAVEIGISKVNFATELRVAMTGAVRSTLENNADLIDPKEFLKKAREAVKEAAVKKIVLCGSSQKA